MSGYWTDEEIQFVKDNHKSMKFTDKDLALKFNVSVETISAVRRKFGIKKTGNEVCGVPYTEQLVIDILEGNNIDFLHNELLDGYIPDFKIGSLIIEVQGDYYHCNPRIYKEGPKDDVQLRHIVRDYYKKCYYLSSGYTLLEIWENDLINNVDKVKEEILNAVLRSNS